jgi:signal transduction histidine kinase/Tfp pilus assembly protein PilF
MIRRIFVILFFLSHFINAQTTEALLQLEELQERMTNKQRDESSLELFIDCTLFLGGYDPELSIEYSTYFIDVATELEAGEELARIYNFRANTYRLLGVPDLALRDYLKGIELAEATGDLSKRYYFQIDVGNVYFDLNEFDRAEAYYHSVVRAAAADKLYEVQAVAVNNLGLVDLKRNRLDDALRHFRKGYQLRLAHGTDFQISHSAEYVGRVFSMLGQKDSADFYYQSSLQLAYRDVRLYGRQRIYQKRAEHHLRFGEFAPALSDLDSSMFYAKILDDKQIISELHLVIADYYVEKKQPKRALKELEKAIAVAEKPQFNREIFEGYYKAYEIYRDMGDAGMALQNFIYADSLEKIIRDKSSALRVSQTQYERLVNEKEKELFESEQQSEIQKTKLQAQLERNNILIAAVAVILFFLVLITIAMYKINISRKRLKENQDLIELQNREIEDKNQKLEKAIQEAKNSLNVKSDFLNKMSHEIRTPMNAILGLTELLLSNTNKENEDYENLRTIHSSGTILLELINEILDYSRIESGRVEISEEEFSIRQTLEDHLRLIRTRIEKNNNKVFVSVDNQIDFMVVADRVKYIQILTNLTSNAAKFCSNGEIHITVDYRKEDETHWIKTSVSDTGIGIAHEKLEFIFDQFTQASSNIHRMYGGTGLGLSISKGLSEVLGGTIAVESEIGKGTTFSFDIPISIGGGNERVVLSEEFCDRPKLKGKVLVVEDDVINMKLITQILKKWNLQFETAENGAKGLMVFDETFDVLLVDIQMPVMDGLEMSKRIRQSEFGKEVPIIILTADVLGEASRNAREVGVDEVLTKPYKQKDLLHLLRKYLSE